MSKVSFKAVLLVFAAVFLGSCDIPMGLGDPIDLEAPILRVEKIELPDGKVIPIEEEGGKIFIGPGIMFGSGAVLKGTAWDNIGVEEIRVVETGNNVSAVFYWESRDISSRSADGWQSWSISLEGIEKGERAIEITAYDRTSLSGQPNIGPETVKALTLLVDTDPPFVDKIWIERAAGIFADLMPRTMFESVLDPEKFEYVDYYQNERFTIRAEISHEYSLMDVSINFIDDMGKNVFPVPRRLDGGTYYTPYWDFTASDFSAYPSGMNYLKVVVTATAQAGHTGSNTLTNNLYNLCWYPESDHPRIVVNVEGTVNNAFQVSRSSIFPLQVFDDDNMKEAYYALVAENDWNTVIGATDDLKMQTLLASHKSGAPFSANQIKATARNSVIPVTVGRERGDYRLIVFAYDNKDVMSQKLFTVYVVDESELKCDLVAITCDQPDSAYPRGSTLSFKMIFSGKVYTAGNASITIEGGTGGNEGGPITINMTPVAQASADFALTGSHLFNTDVIFDPVRIVSVNIAGVQRATHGMPPAYDNTVLSKFHSERAGLKVLTVKPRITEINGHPVADNETVLVPDSGGKSTLRLTFSHAVWPENGTITVKPASGWRIPPVLTNDEYISVSSALSIIEQGQLFPAAGAVPSIASYYIRTTHGLKHNLLPANRYVPDTDTKYVLNFTSNIENNTVVRPYLEKAKFHWHEVDVNSIKGEGSRYIEVDLDQLYDGKLPVGRLWKVEITGPNSADGAFRDEAGNTFDGWAAASNHTFWSDKTATPVIRVERVSNNRSYTTRPAGAAATLPARLDTNEDAIFQQNVRYRIDCETPGSAIQYNTVTNKVSAIENNMTVKATFRPSAIDGAQNSNIADATFAELNANITSLSGYTNNALLEIGDNSLYTARKDYIVAEATRAGLARSDRGYEGAFKTLIIFRNFVITTQTHQHPGWTHTGNAAINMNTSLTHFLRLEAANTDGGAVTIAGFPMKYNDMTGKSARNFYRNPNTNAGANNVDWIWISWEMVSDFWHVPMIDNSPLPFYKLNSPQNGDSYGSWDWTCEDWYVYSIRKYGNWGLRVGNNPGP
jgi:hypothetical protein